jgi:hypothetical protein
MDTTSRIINLLPSIQKQEILQKAIKGIKEQLCTIISNLSSDKLILAHEYLTKLENNETITVHTVIKSGPIKDIIVEPESPSTSDSISELIFSENLYIANINPRPKDI